MIRDVDYAFFAQLAYLNWNNLTLDSLKKLKGYNDKKLQKFLKNEDEVWNKIKIDDLEPFLKNDILMYYEADKRLFGTFGIKKSKENSKFLEPLYNFDGWQFIYSADKTKLYKDKYNIDLDDDGFYGVAFMKDDKIVLSYRGTEPTTVNDLLTDLEIGFLNKNSSQLVSAYLFLEYVKELFPKKSYYITGHSLGGCLAQYASLCSGENYPTVTWNALGIGRHKADINESFLLSNDITKYIKLGSVEAANKIKEYYLNGTKISNNLIISSESDVINKISILIGSTTTSTLKSGITNIFSKGIGELNIKLGIGNSRNGQEFLNEMQSESIKEDAIKSAIQIYWLLKSIKNYQIVENNNNFNITNYYNSLDWTAVLQTREGKIIDVLTGESSLKEETDDSVNRIVKESFDKFSFTYHGVNDFLIYMDKNGKVVPGVINEVFAKNSLKKAVEYILKEDNNKNMSNRRLKIKDKVTEENIPFKDLNLIIKKKQMFNNKISIFEKVEIKYLIPVTKAVHNKIDTLIEKRIKNKEIDSYVIGHLSNIDLCGITGGKPLFIYKKERAKKEQRKKQKKKKKKKLLNK